MFIIETKLSCVGNGIFNENKVNPMDIDVLAPCQDGCQ